MKILTYEEIEKELYIINSDFITAKNENNFTLDVSDALINRCFNPASQLDKHSKFKQIFKRMRIRRSLDSLTIIIYSTPTK